ncbi:hypothetical protein SCHPADRAFT_939706 [Schizopora paradoxa]|uniref:EF-hand domain-containing protein n=1 Tax=Schizopora paradoxa TaxID=27342 RepID=A0A0H2RQP2_9AGAM|nr:hypothetical protein SCHPADRAFT_939706 [Schizopora paradoxa]
MSYGNYPGPPVNIPNVSRRSSFRQLQLPAKVRSRNSMRRMDTTQSVYSFDASQGRGKGHGEINLYEGDRDLRPDYERFKYKSDRASSDVKDFFDKMDDDREEKESGYSVEAHNSDNGLAKLLRFFVNGSVFMRWFWCIVPVLILIWIPGIVGVTASKHAMVIGVKLLWWSVWLTIAWCSLWAGMVVARLLPPVVRNSVGVVFPRTKQVIDWLSKLHRYVAVVSWSIAMFVSFSPLIRGNVNGTGNEHVLNVLWKLLLAQLILVSILLGEKLLIQWIASRFNKRAYADRVENQQHAVHVLSRLCEVVGWENLEPGGQEEKGRNENNAAAQKMKNVTFGAMHKAKTAVNAFANELSGSNVVEQTPEIMVMQHLVTEAKARALATSLFDGLISLNTKVKPTNVERELVEDDLMVAFPMEGDRKKAFDLFDKDGNGDLSLEELQMACVDFHKEENNLIHSQRDVKSAVGRLNAIFMILYVVIVILVIAVCLEAQALTLVTGAGAFMLGLSWLIGGPIQEVITSIIFLFIKHPYDDGDRVCIEEEIYLVREIRLLSTIFMNKNGCLVQAPNSILSTKFIENVRRSKQMSERFEFEVAYTTTTKQVSDLQERMQEFVLKKNRDFLPNVYISVQDIPEQENLVLAADIRYKSNWQHTDVKVRRRNEWIGALKQAMADLEIFGPKGKPEDTEKETLAPPAPLLAPPAVDMDMDKMRRLQEMSSVIPPAVEIQMPTPVNVVPARMPSSGILKRRPLPSMPNDAPYDVPPDSKQVNRPYTTTYAQNPNINQEYFTLPPTRPLSVGARVPEDNTMMPDSRDFIAQYRDDYSDISSPGVYR